MSGALDDLAGTAEGIEVLIDGGVLRLTIDRPDRKGALHVAAVQRLIDSLEAAGTDDALRVVVITGRGDDFCSGADVVVANKGADVKPRPGSLQRRTALQAHRLIALLVETQLPVVCGVQGWAAGLGCQIALAADVTVAAESARFWLPFTQRGFTPDSGATWLLPRLIGVARAKNMLLLGREVSGAEAASWGMVHSVVADADLEDAVESIADQLAHAATVALGLTKRCIATAADGGLTDAMADEALALELSSRTADFREGLAAFGERREPRYEGR